MRVRGAQDVAAGAAVIAFAVAVVVALSRIPKAKFQAFSPDLFPRLCAYALVAGGIALIVRGLLRAGPSFERPPWRGVVLVVLAVVAFGLVTPRLGYAIGGFLTVLLAGFATRDVKPLKLVAFAAGLIAFSVVLFSVLLKVPMPAFILPGLGR